MSAGRIRGSDWSGVVEKRIEKRIAKAKKTGLIHRSSRERESLMDARSGRSSSLPGAYKSWYADEAAPGWSAPIKVDYDFDKTKPKAKDVKAVAAFLKKHSMTASLVRAYTTRRGLHLRVWVDPDMLTDAQILSVQERLGDDPMRCVFNAARVERGEIAWNVLFCRKARNGKIISQEEYSREWTAKFMKWFGVGA